MKIVFPVHANHQPKNAYLEEPVSRVLGVGLREIEELDRGGVPTDLRLEHIGVVFQVPAVEGKALGERKKDNDTQMFAFALPPHHSTLLMDIVSMCM